MVICTKTHGSSESQQTRKIGPSVRICQINIEGISRAKSQYLSKLLQDNDIDLVTVQETHVKDEADLASRGKVPGYEILGATYDLAYGTATYIRNTIENAVMIDHSSINNIHVITAKIGEVTVTNVYKPPNTSWPQHVLHQHTHPSVYVGDFNSHHQEWKYENNDANGEALINWAENHNLHLVFDAKDRGTFKSAAWQREYNPDLCFVSKDNNNLPLATSRKVLPDFPRSQHRPVLIEIGIQVPLVSSIPRPRWNFKKANWPLFTNELDKCLRFIPPTSDNYNRFVDLVISTAKKTIPRGYRKEYIPGWSDTSENLYQEFLESGNQEIADDLLHSLDAARRQKWIETVEALNFTQSSRQAWSLLRKLGSGNPPIRDKLIVNPNAIATHIVSISRAPRDRDHTIQVKRELKGLKAATPLSSEYSRPFTDDDITKALEDVKTGKAPGFDGIHPEFLINLGKHGRRWMAKFLTDILRTGKIPRLFKQTKIIAILKPGKPNDRPDSYRPIALLSASYKLLERLLYNRISLKILEGIPVEQAGFRPKRSCSDQVLSLTTHIEAGFQKQLKTSVAFIDLTAAYDTVWRQGMLYKLLCVIPCKTTVGLIDQMLSNRSFRVVMGNSLSDWKKLNNGLPQGSVLAPLLFSLYIADMPTTRARKFGYADDWAIATSSKSMEETEKTLTDDLNILKDYFRKWRLQPNANKTEVTCFHLNNRLARRELNVRFGNGLLRHNRYPKYLGVTLDRTLSFKEHLAKTAAKLKTRNNILQKLCGTTWGSSASTLRSTALGLVYSVAEYCAPVWLNSPHVKTVDIQLNHTMRMISGTIRSTPCHWLPILSHITPPGIRRSIALIREYNKILENPHLPINTDISDIRRNRLRSRKPSIKTAENLKAANFNPINEWKQEWTQATTPDYHNMPCITVPPAGFELPRKTWTTLNRIRTNHGRCADAFYRWNILPSSQCDCNAERQTIRHIIQECTRRAYTGHSSDFLIATPGSIDYINNLDLSL